MTCDQYRESASARLDGEGQLSMNLDLPAKGKDEISRLSRAFNDMSAQLAKAKQMEADFLAVASHELKTPLAVIQAQARMLREALPPEGGNGEAAAGRTAGDDGAGAGSAARTSPK